MALVSYLPHVLSTVLVLYLYRKYRERKWGRCTNGVDLHGKIAIVTGANCGIGYEVAKELAKRNAQVILACRDMDKARDAIASIKSTIINDPQLLAMELDLASLHSVKNFCDKILKNYPTIDILVNNAGVQFPPIKRVETKDGFEVHFGVNHLGPFYLTNLLLDTLTTARIIVVSSSLHEKGAINLSDLNDTKKDTKNKKLALYSNSKLANVYFAKELAKRTQSTGTRVYTCCPGWVYTQLFRNSLKLYHFVVALPFVYLFMRTPKQGAQTPIYCATDPDIEKESGFLYRDCQHYDSTYPFDETTSQKLWEQSEKMIKTIMGSNSGL